MVREPMIDERRREGARAGLILGGIGAVLGLVTTLWWLIAALPAGVAAGVVAARWIVPAKRIPIRAVVTGAVVADGLAILIVVGFLDLAAAVHDPTLNALGLLMKIIAEGAIGLAVAGPWALFITVPYAYVGARIVRQRLTRAASLEPASA
jgi:hypothetical protein